MIRRRNAFETLGLIVARGGSKGIPGKNIRELDGRPLIAHAAEAAREAARLSRIVLSTDSPEIADIAEDLGIEVPFLRPAELARDATPTLPVVQHALQALLQAGARYDAVCLLQPTHPLRTAALIDRCVEKLRTSGADSVFTVTPVPHSFHPNWVYLSDEEGRLEIATGGREPVPRRQELPPAFAREGSVYVTRAEVIRRGSLYGESSQGVVVSPGDSVNLDTEADWEEAERRLAERARRVSEQDEP